MNINLKPWQVNLILTALAKMPYEEVAATIADIKEQIAEDDEDDKTYSGLLTDD